VASLLSASFHETIWVTVEPNFPLNALEVIAAVSAALATNNPIEILALAAALDGYNNGYE